MYERISELHEPYAFYLPNQQEKLASQAALVPFLNQFENFLERYFEVTEKVAKLTESIYYELPLNYSNILLEDEGSEFGDPGELETLSAVSGVGLAGILTNFIIGIVCIIGRILRRKGLKCELDCLQCCCKKRTDIIHPIRNEMVESVPLQSRSRGNEQIDNWPVSVPPSWPRN